MELEGKNVGFLTVIRRDDSVTKGRDKKWICRCECGNEISVSASRLNKGRVKSCGCHNGDNFRKHNMKYTRIHRIWCSMKQRCDKKRKTYRDISYCDEWKEFIPFYEWSMRNGYSDELTLDRINSYGNYEPSNCRWVSQKIQQNNRTNNTRYTLNDETHTLSEWSDITGICSSTLSARILKLGWSVEKALTTPIIRGRIV